MATGTTVPKQHAPLGQSDLADREPSLASSNSTPFTNQGVNKIPREPSASKLMSEQKVRFAQAQAPDTPQPATGVAKLSAQQISQSASLTAGNGTAVPANLNSSLQIAQQDMMNDMTKAAKKMTAEVKAGTPAADMGKAGAKPNVPGAATTSYGASQPNPAVAPPQPGASASTSAAAAANGTAAGPSPAALATPTGKLIHAGKLLEGLYFGWLTCMVLLLALLRPGLWLLGKYLLLGLTIGLFLSHMYFKNRRNKAEINQVLCKDPGLKGLTFLLGHIPTWINYTEREKMEWFNKLMVEMWPYYDTAICKMIKEQAAPIMQMVADSVPGIKRMGFQELTFGDAPFRVEGVWASEEPGAVVMELDVRWCGDANISLAIELPGGGDLTTMCPKVTDIVFVGTVRVILKPLVGIIPCFGAAVIALKRPPSSSTSSTSAKPLASSVTAAPVERAVKVFVLDNVVESMLWPKRQLVQDTGYPEIDLAIDKLASRPRGVLRVLVSKAENLKAKELQLSKKSDPVVELWTDVKHKARTKVKHRTVAPVWEETHYVLVKEPMDEVMRLEVSDIDLVTFTTDISNILHGQEMIGRSVIPLAPFAQQEGQDISARYPLGRLEWSTEGGTGKGCGSIQLTCQYRSFGSFSSRELQDATRGVVLVSICAVRNIPAASARAFACYVAVRVDKKEHKTLTQKVKVEKKQKLIEVPFDKDQSSFEFHDIAQDSVVRLRVMEVGLGLGPLAGTDELGSIDLLVADIAESSQLNTLADETQAGYLRRAFELEEGDGGQVEIIARFVPYF